MIPSFILAIWFWGLLSLGAILPLPISIIAKVALRCKICYKG